MRHPKIIIAGLGVALAAAVATGSAASTSPAAVASSAPGTAAAASTAGTLDHTFGKNGIVLTNQGFPAAAVLQSNGDIVVAVGSGSPGSGLARFLPNGARDTTFGNGGFAALPNLGIPSVHPGLAVQSDGKLVWAGEATASNGTGSTFAVVRFNANGTLDQGFGAGGLATTTFPVFNASVQGAQTVLIQPDGKILIGGENITGNPSGTSRAPEDFGALARFNAGGSIDTSFGTGGQVQVGNSDFTVLGLDASGDIFTLPSHLEFSPAGQPDATLTPAVITTASHNGTVTFLPSGGFVAGTEVFTGRRGDPDVQVTRFNPDGSTVSTSTATGIDYAGQNGALAASDGAAAVAIQANGQAVIGGTHTESGQFSSTSVFGLARFNADSSLDPAFGTGGVLTTRIQGNDSVSLLVIQPDGKILAIGTSQNAAGVQELALARYLSQ
ncbi:MAG TPA: hypothetical protein VJ418_24575 [Streptosporangiaceae bacterium]|nr:hypothetical protein [Streptosporangiaceae bacterium]